MGTYIVQAGCWLLIAVVLAAGAWGVWLLGDTFMPMANAGFYGASVYSAALAGAALLMWARRAKPSVHL